MARPAAASPLHPANPGAKARSVCVIVPKDVREFVLSLGAIEAIAAIYPRAELLLATEGEPNRLAEACPFIDRTASLEQIDFKQARFDVVFDLGDPDVSKTAYKLSSRKTVWCGHQQDAAMALASDAPRGRLARLRNQLSVAGVPFAGELPTPDFGWIAPHFDHAPRLQPAYFGLNGPYAFIALDGSPSSAPASWEEENFLKLTKTVANMGLTPALVGESAEGPLAQSIQTKERRAVNLVNRTETAQLATLSETAQFAVGANNAGLTVAALRGRPGIVLQVATSETVADEKPVGAPYISFYSPRLNDIAADMVCRMVISSSLTNP